MNRKWFLIGGVVTLLAIVVGTSLLRSAVKKTSQSLAIDPVSHATEQAQPVGWVFGRVIGFPGAEKPLMLQGMGGSAHGPATSEVRP